MMIITIAWCANLAAFEGKVLLQDGTPIADATVSILGYPGSGRTDAEGRFSWTPDPPVPFEVLIVMPGGQYMAPVLVEELPSDGSVLIAVSPLVAESVTVTAAVTPNIEAPPASGMSLVPQEAIEVRHPVRLTDAIQNVPGSGRLSDLHAAVPSLRGLARGRTLILIDGARVTSERRAGASATFLDPFFLEGIEVSRGPGSVSYGSDAFGGIIHARTRHAEPGTPLSVRFRGSLGAGLPERSAGAEVRQGLANGGLVFQARYRDYDEYRSPEGEVLDSQASDRGWLARFGHEVGSGLFSIGWQSDHGRDIGRPTTRSDTVSTSYPREDSERITVSYDMDSRGGFSKLGLVGFLGGNRLVTDRENLPDETSPRSLLRSDVRANDFSLRGLAVRPLGQARVELGLDMNGRFGLEAVNTVELFDLDDALATSMENVAIDNARRNDTAVYSNAEVLLSERFTGSGGVRFDYITTRNQGGEMGDLSTANSALSGYASLKAVLTTGLNLTGQVSSGFRDPTLSDRYFSGVSGRGFVAGNPDLGPERSLQFDGALRFVKGGIRWGLFAYHYRIMDLIERYEEGEDLFFFRNRGEGRITGLEFEVQGAIKETWTYEIGAQAATGATVDDDQPLDDIPSEKITLQLRKELGVDGYVQARLAIYAADNDPGPTERVVPSFATVDLGGGWTINRHFQLRLMVRNLLDKPYPVSPDRRAVLAPGINAVATVVGEF